MSRSISYGIARRWIGSLAMILLVGLGLLGCQKTALAPAVIAIDSNALAVEWEPVEHANRYAIYADDVKIAETTGMSYLLDALVDDEPHLIRLESISDESKYLPSFSPAVLLRPAAPEFLAMRTHTGSGWSTAALCDVHQNGFMKVAMPVSGTYRFRFVDGMVPDDPAPVDSAATVSFYLFETGEQVAADRPSDNEYDVYLEAGIDYFVWADGLTEEALYIKTNILPTHSLDASWRCTLTLNPGEDQLIYVRIEQMVEYFIFGLAEANDAITLSALNYLAEEAPEMQLIHGTIVITGLWLDFTYSERTGFYILLENELTEPLEITVCRHTPTAVAVDETVIPGAAEGALVYEVTIDWGGEFYMVWHDGADAFEYSLYSVFTGSIDPRDGTTAIAGASRTVTYETNPFMIFYVKSETFLFFIAPTEQVPTGADPTTFYFSEMNPAG